MSRFGRDLNPIRDLLACPKYDAQVLSHVSNTMYCYVDYYLSISLGDELRFQINCLFSWPLVES